ncbi:MAG: hypothetical protein AABX52_02560 [Nanoarchaeota archaeon]
MKTIVVVLAMWVLLFFSLPVVANHNVFDQYIDRSSLSWFDRRFYVTAARVVPCIDLDEFYAYADSNPFDGYDRSGVHEYLDKLSVVDFRRVAAQNLYDDIDDNQFEMRRNYGCSTREQFFEVADKNPFDDLGRDAYYESYGYKDRTDFVNQIRHDSFEPGSYVDSTMKSSGPVRYDRFGGVASWVRFE